MEGDTDMTVIEDNLGHFFDATDEAINEALTVVGMNAANYARNNAPVDTGHLRNSISLSMPLDERNTVIIGSNVEYAPYQELATICATVVLYSSIWSLIAGRK